MRNFNQTGVQMLRRFRPLPVVIVPARIEESDERLLEAVRQRFALAFDDFTPPVLRKAGLQFWDLRIPYQLRYAFEERVIIDPKLVDEERPITESFRHIVRCLSLLANDSSALAQKLEQGPDFAPTEATLRYDPTRQLATFDACFLYDRNDSSAVGAICQRLEQDAGLRIWRERSLALGTHWEAQLEEALLNTNSIVVAISDAGVKGLFLEEVNFVFDAAATRQSFRIIPVILPHATIQFPQMPRRLREIEALDLRESYKRRLEQLIAAIRGESTSIPAPQPDVDYGSPYVGPQPFTEQQAVFFAGREAILQHLLGQVRARSFTVLTGTEGSGKTSLVQAGLCRILRQEGWKIHALRLGETPKETLQELVALFQDKASAAGFPSIDTSSDPAEVAQWVTRVAGEEPALIFLDQFEEFAGAASNGQLAKFFIALSESAQNAKLLAAVRDDAIPTLATKYPELAPLLKQNQVTLPPLGPEELQDIIEQPARRAGLAFEPGVVNHILRDFSSDFPSLPLLQMILQELYRNARDGRLTNDAYDRIGGAAGLLSAVAETTFRELTTQEQKSACWLLLRLVRLSTNGAPTRRLALVNELSSPDLTKGDIDRALRKLGDAHPLRISKRHGETAVELAHEALVYDWPRLQALIDEARQDLMRRDKLDGISQTIRQTTSTIRKYFSVSNAPKNTPAVEVTDASSTTLTEQAKEVLRNRRGTADNLFALAKSLKKIQKFNLARRILALASKQWADPALARQIVQQHASCTEKDPDLPLDRRYQRAIDIIAGELKKADAYLLASPNETEDHLKKSIYAHQETFGIAGAIHKRWWQVDAQIRHLVKAQELYDKGWQLATLWSGAGIPDQGYTGINAAFVLDLLAQQVPEDEQLVKQRRSDASAIREKIRARLSPLPAAERDNWWTLVTLAEACFGLGDYEGARHWLRRTAQIEQPQRWEYETTVKQLAELAMIQAGGDKTAEEFVDTEAWSVLRELVGEDEAGLRTAFSGKVGLALSGGGFRASLFHIGVLARLAELDMLRHVEVLSCVSGGSIIGALYYLKVRKLLESKPDNDITPADYIQIVREMEEELTVVIEHNPGRQVFSQLALLGTRTEEMGKLLDTTPYGAAAGLPIGERPQLRHLIIRPPFNQAEVALPPEDRSPFVPKYDNWRRAHKVPILIINATTLNTGHNWQFTATFMGESPNQIVPEVDGNERLRRMYFSESMPTHHKSVPLGLAVAASAAVPGLFRPVKLAGLYENRDVELVDGGVHDNQGIAGLLEQDCKVILASDASGQLVSEPHPSRLETSVLWRSNNTLMARVRELEYRELTARKEAGLLRDLLFVHLKKDLAVEPVDWLECDLAKESSETPGVPPGSHKATDYEVRGDVQNLLAGIRTDLDVFSEAEACALMSSGYKMTAHYFPECVKSFKSNVEQTEPWRFQQVDAFLAEPKKASVNSPEPSQISDFLARLKLGAQLLFKAPQLLPSFSQLQWMVWVGVIVAILIAFGIGALALVVLLWRLPLLILPLVSGLIMLVATLVVLARGGLYAISRWLDELYIRKGSLTELLRPRVSHVARHAKGPIARSSSDL